MSNFEKKILLSAVQPSHQLTLGNYLGALKNWVLLQEEYVCLFFVVDLHALTVPPKNPKQLQEDTYYVLASYLAAGISEKTALLFIQSHVTAHSELAWILNCLTYMGELSRMTQFKDKTQNQGKNISTGLFNYPVLMAADILLYQTHLVPVGLDQKQHLELTRDLALRFNKRYQKQIFTLPEPYCPPVGGRIMSLQNPLMKMSKSDPNANGSIYLTDSPDVIVKKLKGAVTDSGREVRDVEEKPGIRNLIHIQAALLNQSPETVIQNYEGKLYGQLKMETADCIIAVLKPLRERIEELILERTELDRILQKGAEQARLRATKTLSVVQNAIGLVSSHL